MKCFPILTLALLFLFPGALCAQLNKGTWYTSGAAGGYLPVAQGLGEFSILTTSNPAEVNLTGLLVSPELGYFFSRRILAGSRLSFALAYANGALDFNGIAVVPFVRYYFNPTASNNHFYANAQLNLSSQNFYSGLGSSLGLGMTHFLAPGLGWDISLALSRPDFQYRQNPQLGLFTGLNVYLNPELKANLKQALPALQAGSLMIGGTTANTQFSLGSSQSNRPNAWGLLLSPNVLYFVTQQLGVGGVLSLSAAEFGDRNDRTTFFGISPAVRYYLHTERRQLWFVTGAYHYNWGIATLAEQKSDIRISRASVALGFNHFVSPNLALELAPNLNYQFNNDALRIGLDLGVQFFLHPKPHTPLGH